MVIRIKTTSNLKMKPNIPCVLLIMFVFTQFMLFIVLRAGWHPQNAELAEAELRQLEKQGQRQGLLANSPSLSIEGEANPIQSILGPSAASRSALNSTKALVANSTNSSRGLDEWKALSLPHATPNHPLASAPDVSATLALSMDRSMAVPPISKPNVAPGLHVFYYAWYGTPQQDGKWIHWNHQVLPHWTPEVNQQYPDVGQKHMPPKEIGSNYYPSLGPYSSKDPKVIETHVRQIAEAGIGSIVYSWWGRGTGDSNGDPTDEAIIEMMLHECAEQGINMSFHIEPYKGRSAESVKADAIHIVSKYGSHRALCRDAKGRPVLYVYDSYHTPASEWATVLSRGHAAGGVRGGVGDALFLGLWVEEKHGEELYRGGFDGCYTYFATDGFTYGSTRQNWKTMAKFASDRGLQFVPSFGPGYVDTAIRPWNQRNSRDRGGGQYFNSAWEKADELGTQMLSITSFNEWHEGTQIEPAKTPEGGAHGRYLDYEGKGEGAYLEMVRKHVDMCLAERTQAGGSRGWCQAPDEGSA